MDGRAPGTPLDDDSRKLKLIFARYLISGVAFSFLKTSEDIDDYDVNPFSLNKSEKDSADRRAKATREKREGAHNRELALRVAREAQREADRDRLIAQKAIGVEDLDDIDWEGTVRPAEVQVVKEGEKFKKQMSQARTKMSAAEKAERAEQRAALREQLKELGGKTYTKKKAKRKFRRGYRKKGFSWSVPNATISGIGAYGRQSRQGRAFGEAAGGIIGDFLPGSLSALKPFVKSGAGWLGNKIGSWLGIGAYQLNRNSLVIDEGNSPLMMHSDDDTIIVRHREYVGEVYSAAVAGEFTVQNYPLQPGLDELFEWLAPIAGQYQEWIPMGIIAEFKSNSGEVVTGATNALGQVIMSTDYNAYNQQPFTNKAQMNNTVYSTNAKITQSFVHAIECDPRKNVMESLFVRSGPVPPGQPPQLYDLGTFAIASVGCQGESQDLGELWFSYEIALRKATLTQTAAAAIATDYFISNSQSMTPATPFEGMVPSANNSLGCTFDETGAIMYFPPLLEQGRYQITHFFYTNDGAPIVLPHDLTFKATNATIPNFWGVNVNTPRIQQGMGPASNEGLLQVFFVDIQANNASIAVDNVSGWTTGGQFWVAEMTVCRVNMDLSNPDLGP